MMDKLLQTVFLVAIWGTIVLDHGIASAFFRQRTIQHRVADRPAWSDFRGGDQELTLDEKVQRAMEKLGLQSPVSTLTENDQNGECEGGVCPVPPPPPQQSSASTTTPPPPPAKSGISEQDVVAAATKLAESMNVDESLAMAAFSATSTTLDDDTKMFHEEEAKAIIQQELNMIDTIPVDSKEAQTLTSEGFDEFLSRRALAFAEGNIDDARAILLADQEDELAEERQHQEQLQKQQSAQKTKDIFRTVTVDSKIDPTQLGDSSARAPVAHSKQPTAPTPAKKEDVVFEATTAQIQKLVLESPVPVLLDVYADWCGPCKVLGPALEEMAVKSGGMFRLVKVNSDNERPVSTALEVTALPTVFGVKDGKIVHMFQGMPRSEDAMKNFMMGLLMGENNFDPPLTIEQKDNYQELTAKMVKMAATASFSFSARERLQDRVATQLEKLVEERDGDPSKAEESARVVRSLLSNIIRNPTETKFRTAKLSNAVLQAKVAPYTAACALLKSVGFVESTDSDDNKTMKLGGDKKFVNIAPLAVARDSIDKWIDKSRYEIAKAARKRKDEEERARLQAEGAFDKEEEEDEEDEEDPESLNTCMLKVRMAGKKKVFNLSMAATDTLSNVVAQLPIKDETQEVQITCVAKKLIVKSSDKSIMEDQSLEQLGLTPSAALVVDVKSEDTTSSEESNKGSLAERAAKKKKKSGSHTMQSIGIYSKDDNSKGELIDGGGDTLWEHDVSDDEEEVDKDEEDNQTDDEGATQIDEH